MPSLHHVDDVYTQRLDVASFADGLGVAVEDVPLGSKAIIDQSDLCYREINAEECKRLEGEILGRINAGGLSRSGPSRHREWEDGWAENLEQFRLSGGDVRSLTPKYYTRRNVHRFFGRFVEARSQTFEVDWFRAFIRCLFHRYFIGVDGVVEFGCGPGYNLVDLADEFANIQLIGCDWANSACELIDELAIVLKIPLRSRLFDMFDPDMNFQIPEGYSVLTVGALEQIGERFEKFLDYLISQRPRVCVHVEPLVELYRQTDPFDALAVQYHKARGYLTGYLPEIRRRALAGEIVIEREVRCHVGGLYHENAVLVWRPA
ncbi:MAG: hypothetical protein ISR47_01060 [Rhodospirillales bacterium]|nr:hypothetical protein [Rhodospirillales bacterium]